ncbi:hypothetical protein ACFWGD_05900 [Corynebacterium sp. NPDC060344]|uniref:hypothetical protein n=1 Tax=Corynebacterium sp. NPDC060344 TaxID=3347101 RepID=UPI0036689551
MRSLFLVAAAIHTLLVAAVMLTLNVDIMVLSAIALLATLIIGGVAFARRGRGAGMWAGALAGLIAIAGWGSWLVLWAMDPGRGGAAINIWGILLPGLAVLVYLVAAALPSSAGTRRTVVE